MNVGRRREGGCSVHDFVRDGEGVGVDDLVVEHDAVEGAIDTVVDVV